MLKGMERKEHSLLPGELGYNSGEYVGYYDFPVTITE